MRRATRRRWVGAAAVGLLVLPGLAACTSSPPGPRQAAEQLAAVLPAGDLASLDLADTNVQRLTATRTAAFEGLSGWTATVVATPVLDEDDDAKATVQLAWTWDVPDRDDEWTYTTSAEMVRDDADVWRTTLTAADLAPDLTDGERLVVERDRPPRADVLAGDGSPIVEPRPVHRIGIDKTRVDAAGQAKAAASLAKALELDVDAYVQRVAAAGPKAFVEAIVVRDSDRGYDVARLAGMTGVNAVPDTLPLAPTRTFARPVLGTVGQATAELVEQSKGAVVAGDLAGLSGLQRQYDAQLRGRPGVAVTAVGADGAERELFRVEAVAGTPLRTTLDVGVQKAAEAVLRQVGPASAIVAIRPSTGDVLAAASGPGGDGLSTATLGQYPPGSTFKVVTTLALLRAGLTPDSEVACTPSVDVDGREFRNFPDYPSDRLGTVSLRTAFANSCNAAFIAERDKAPMDEVAAAAGSLGLTGQADLGASGFFGEVPARADGTAHAAALIGQGQVLASPLGMATVAASVARGATVHPRLVVPDDGARSPSAAPDGGRDAEPLTADEADALRSLMRSVVTEGGATFLQDAPGGEVAAKTGTAQFGPTGGTKNHAWMIAVQGDLAVAVFVAEGDYGSTTAGPLLEDLLRRLHG
ncbi:penicillin-binding transpeptidase domain-containing protein [Cellulomonas massiliensis]|uniref:penicillin-binding transpeptidase domain-containing protein n=1 Tax=Cellulomonas massiliensis TaxID=1465811 RepID=UPI000318D16F|nr:penicillin-binding transpeptidase domain-containing protein [Cellulomonas massiliensis]